MKHILILFTLFVSGSVVTLQANPGKAVSSAEINYDLEVTDDGGSGMGAMIGNASMIISFDGDLVKSYSDMGMVSSTSVVNNKSKEGYTAINMMGKKVATRLTEEDYGDATDRLFDKDAEIEYTEEYKEIAGYNCQKVLVTNSDGTQLDFFVTSKIQPKSNVFDAIGIEGFPLEFQISQMGMEFTLTAESVVKDPDTDFSLDIPEGYTEYSKEEFDQIMGSYGG